MQLTTPQIKKFQYLYRKYFSLELAEADAQEMGMRLVNLIRSVEGRTKPTNKNYNEQTRPTADL